MWNHGEEVRVKELTGIVWVRDVFCNTAQGGIVIHATGPNLRRVISGQRIIHKECAYSAVLVNEKGM
jgi:hypothetical protein